MDYLKIINKSDFVIYNFLLVVFVLFVLFVATIFIRYSNSNVVAAAPELNLPSYVGPCAGLVKITHDALRSNYDLYRDKNIASLNERKRFYHVNVIAPIANAFTYANFCPDKEAIGLMLSVDANITLDSAFNGITTFNESVPLARSYYNEAQTLHYWDEHYLSGYLLAQRIQRNQFRVNIKAPF